MSEYNPRGFCPDCRADLGCFLSNRIDWRDNTKDLPRKLFKIVVRKQDTSAVFPDFYVSRARAQAVLDEYPFQYYGGNIEDRYLYEIKEIEL